MLSAISSMPFSTALHSDEELAPSDPNGSGRILIISSGLSAPFHIPPYEYIKSVYQYVKQQQIDRHKGSYLVRKKDT